MVLDGSMAWDRPEVPGARVLAGLGVPDIRGSYGDWFVYTTDPSELSREPKGRETSTGGMVFRVDEIGGRIDSRVFGPRDFNDPDRGRLTVPLVVSRVEGSRFRVSLDGVEHDLAEGEWSPWFHPVFEVSSLIKVRAITRVKVVRASDPFELYVDFLQIDPAAPPFWQPVSQPPGFVSELARQAGEPFETVGWACLTMPFKDREIDPVTFLEDIDATRSGRERILASQIARTDWRLLMSIESTPDRVQHMMYQYYDREHPMYDAEKAAQRVRFGGEEIALSEAVPAAYRQVDRLVGEIVDRHLRPEDTLILCADHGFQSFRRGLNLNNWLAEHGYLQTVELRSRSQGQFLQFIDWSRTRAYAVGLGMIFVNQRGRERDGIVDPADASALLEEITRDLLATRDGGKPVVRVVHRMSEIHSGPHLDLESDLMVGLEAGYRVGWSTTTGGMFLVKDEAGGGWKPAPAIDDNTNNWSGDHVSVAADLVPGIFFCNRKVTLPPEGVDLLHIAPTVLSLLGVPVPAEYDRPPLEIAR
jgi:predicted AlkP superfamily phosphohydrolase/phosphomutase